MKVARFLILAIFLVSCSASPTPTTVSSQENNPGTLESAYPAGAVASTEVSSAYPAQGQSVPQEEASALIVPTVDATKGIVKGTILKNGQPVVDVDLYVAELIKDNNNNDFAYSFSREDSPRTQTNEKGEFTLVNVPSGEHGLILDLVVQSYLLLDPNQQKAIQYNIEPGQTIDLGKLDYDDLPTP